METYYIDSRRKISDFWIGFLISLALHFIPFVSILAFPANIAGIIIFFIKKRNWISYGIITLYAVLISIFGLVLLTCATTPIG